MKRARFGIPFAICVLALIVSCSSSEIGESGQAVQQFYGHLNGGDPAAAMDLYTAAVREGFLGPDGSIDESFSRWARSETRQSTIGEVKIISEEVDEGAGTGTVRFELVYTAGESERRTVTMTREDGRWKLGFIDRG